MKIIKVITIFCMIIIMTLLTSVLIFASQKSDIENVLNYYGKSDYKTANQYNKNLSKYANEKCVKKMNAKMKKAYKKQLARLSTNINEYYYTDINNDNKAELLVLCGNYEVDKKLRFYEYKGGQVRYLGAIDAGHSSFHAYIGHVGLIQHFGQMGDECIYLITIHYGKLQCEKIGSRTVKNVEEYLPLGLLLKVHKYDSYMTRYKRIVKECKKKYKYDGNQLEMNKEAASEYKIWNKELKKIYKKEVKIISKSKSKKLKSSQKRWLKKRDSKAESDAYMCRGGSMYPLVYYNSKISYTKKRIKWMIKKYADVGNF